MPHSRVGWIKPIIEEHFHDFPKIPCEGSKRPTYAAMWHRRSIGRYIELLITREKGQDATNIENKYKEVWLSARLLVFKPWN